MSQQPETSTVYEVLVQIGGIDKPLQVVGSVRAADTVLAWQAAKEIFTRRENCTALWVVPRSCVFEGDQDFIETLSQGTSREFRLPGYPSSHRRDRKGRELVADL